MTVVPPAKPRIVVPRRAEGPGGVIGDGLVEIGPDDPEYERWMAYYQRTGQKPRLAAERPAAPSK